MCGEQSLYLSQSFKDCMGAARISHCTPSKPTCAESKPCSVIQSSAKAPAPTHLGLQVVGQLVAGEAHARLLEHALQPGEVVPLAAHHHLHECGKEWAGVLGVWGRKGIEARGRS